MKRLATRTPWWVGEKLDCQKCGASWEMEKVDAFTPIEDDFVDMYRSVSERKAIADGAEPAPIFYVTLSQDGDVAMFICRDCGWMHGVARGGISVPRRLAFEQVDQAPLDAMEAATLEMLKNRIPRNTQRGGPEHGEPYPTQE